MQVVILANAPEALTELCGVSLLERQLRILQRLGFDRSTIVSDTPQEIPAASKSGVITRIVSRDEFQPHERNLFLPGNIYCDARLIRALIDSDRPCVLVDSAPPDDLLPLLRNAEKGPHGFVSGVAVTANHDSLGQTAVVDAAQVPAYVKSMRRNLRPVFFPAPSPQLQENAERIVLDTGQNGVLDIPAIVQSPIEDWIMRWLCRTSVTPNQISVINFVVALIATAFFASGHLWLGMIPALAIGVIDGLDGKQARVKIETTDAGKWEHHLDFVYEISWWAALGFYFQRSAQLPQAWLWFFLILAAEAIDQLAKRIAQSRIDRLLDDYSPFDRFVRLIGARRDVYIWLLVVGLLFGRPAQTYRLCAIWGALTAGVHVLRAVMIATRGKVRSR